jgi:chromosome segregation ATPase
MPDEPTALGVIARLESALGRFEAQREECEKRLTEATRRLADYEPRLGQPFDLAVELDAKRDELKAIDHALASKPEDDAASTAPAADDVDFNQFIVLPSSDDDDSEPADEMAEAA